MSQALVRLFLTVYGVNTVIVQGRERLWAQAYTLKVAAESRLAPGASVEYLFTRLNASRPDSADPRDRLYLTSAELMGWQRKRIDRGDITRGAVDSVDLVAWPRHKDGSLVSGRSLEVLAMYFANLPAGKRYTMDVATKVAHAEAFLAQLERDYPSHG